MHSYKENLHISMFMFFWLENTKTWYNIIERKTFAVVQYFAQV